MDLCCDHAKGFRKMRREKLPYSRVDPIAGGRAERFQNVGAFDALLMAAKRGDAVPDNSGMFGRKIESGGESDRDRQSTLNLSGVRPRNPF